ncbi:MAG TPA: hypothetical protein VIO61_05000 [Anaerolineaceae bacterium]
MADIRCSMCGRNNPEDLQECKFCGARLKPMVAGGLESAQPAAKGEETDWLASLRAEAPADSSASDLVGDLKGSDEEEIPDWLTRLGALDRPQEEGAPAVQDGGADTPTFSLGRLPEEKPSGKPEPSQDEGEDWLLSLRSSGIVENEPTQKIHPAPDVPEEDGLPEWLSNLGESEPPSIAIPAEPEKTGTSPLPEANLPPGNTDWLRSFAANVEQPEPANQPQTSAEPAALPDWLSDFKENSGIEKTPAAEHQDEPAQPVIEHPEAESVIGLDWLAEFSAEQSADQKPDQEMMKETAEEPLPDWLASFSQGERPPSAAGQETLSTAVEQPVEPADSVLPVGETTKPVEPSEETPDWLSAFQGMSEEPPAEPATEEVAPDWLREFQQATAEPGEEEAPATPPLPTPAGEVSETAFEMLEGEEMPAQSDLLKEWLAGMTPVEPTEAFLAGHPAAEAARAESSPARAESSPARAESSPARAEEPPSTGDLPDWLRDLQTSVPDEQAPAEPAGKAASWLQEFQQALPAEEGAVEAFVPGDTLEPEQPGEKEAPQRTPAEAETQPEFPSWLASLDTSTTTAAPSPAAFVEEEPTRPAVSSGSPFAVDLPDWLSQFGESGSPGEGAAAGAAATREEGAAPAELPSWVEAMRPAQSAVPGGLLGDLTEQIVEKAGPLAGLRGVLPGNTLVTEFRSLPVYTGKLTPTDRQVTNANLLEEMLSQETEPKALPARRTQAPAIILRLAVGAALILALLLPLITNFKGFSPIPAVAPGSAGFVDAVTRLSTPATVLVAVEFEAGFSDEMRLASLGVLRSLANRGVRMALVSTNPAGPVLANHLLAEVYGRPPDPMKEAVNLGYLPGGTGSLLELAALPLQNVSGATFNVSIYTATVPFIQPGSRLDQFAAILLITDNPENGRAWIEQTVPALKRNPNASFLVISSAQAAPMLLPYSEAKQIQGMISGLSGGAMFEKQIQKPADAAKSWGAYQLGMLVAIVFIGIGGVLRGLATILRPRVKKGG